MSLHQNSLLTLCAIWLATLAGINVFRNVGWRTLRRRLHLFSECSYRVRHGDIAAIHNPDTVAWNSVELEHDSLHFTFVTGICALAM
jgi:hypothetical protein